MKARATAAKAKLESKAQGQKRAASEAADTDFQVASYTRKKPSYTDGQIKSQCLNYFTRVSNGNVAKATEDQVREATQAVQTMNTLPDKEKMDFAKAFFNAKQTKDFGFLKDYQEKVTAKKIEKEQVNENYYTRTWQQSVDPSLLT